MKSKKLNRKLVLRKQTIANVNRNEMNVLKGGVCTDLGTTCPAVGCDTNTIRPSCGGSCDTMCAGSCPWETICA